MTFLYPSFLWALTALTLPLIIHLFNFRKYKKVYFTNVRFLRQVQIETKSKSKLRELLVLLFRALLIACLVFAFSQPVIHNQTGELPLSGARHISLYVDNSLSMENVGRNGPLLDQARQKAKEIVLAYGVQDKFNVLTNDFFGKQQRFYSREEALAQIDDIKLSGSPRLLDQVIERQHDLLKTSGGKSRRLIVLSDAQKSTFNLNRIKARDSTPVALVPFASNLINNLFIDSCWFASPVQQSGEIQQLIARVVNKGEKTIESGSARLLIKPSQTALCTFSLLPGASTELRFTFECKQSGLNFGSVTIEDYPVVFDDEFYFAFNSKVNVPVYLINGLQPSGGALETLLSNDSLYRLTVDVESKINYSMFRTVDVIVLNQLQEIPTGLISELQKFTEKGGSIIVIPAETSNPTNYTSLLNSLALPPFGEMDSSAWRVENFELSSGFYSGVFERLEKDLNLPLVNRHYKLAAGRANDLDPILRLNNSDVFLGKSRKNQSDIYLFASSLSGESGNFSKHALFVPTFYRMAFSALKPLPLYYPVLGNSAIQISDQLANPGVPPRIQSLDSTVEVIPEYRKNAYSSHLFTRGQIDAPGHYWLKQGSVAMEALAFNYERLESDLACYTVEEINEMIEKHQLHWVKLLNASESDFKEQVLEGSEPKRLWKLFIILALVFLIAELTVLRILK